MILYIMIIELWFLVRKYELVKWFDIDLVITWLWVQTLENQTKNIVFGILALNWICKVGKNPR